MSGLLFYVHIPGPFELRRGLHSPGWEHPSASARRTNAVPSLRVVGALLAATFDNEQDSPYNCERNGRRPLATT